MERRDFLTAAAATGAALATGAPSLAATASAVPAAQGDSEYLQMRIGLGLIRCFVSADKQYTPLLRRIASLRGQLAREQLVLPIVRIRDNCLLRLGQCRILWRDEVLIDVDLSCEEDQRAKNASLLLRGLELAARLRDERG